MDEGEHFRRRVISSEVDLPRGFQGFAANSGRLANVLDYYMTPALRDFTSDPILEYIAMSRQVSDQVVKSPITWSHINPANISPLHPPPQALAH